ncbi:hypothetical protein ASG25_21170 [Rhizobium sp. Leaf384]|nr:hypothetical protein ASG25_21170 [Rhizobium sp. Leaf384]KQS83953.1 hypothetical protein ASG58_21550 [Rhizobium sp. Leaf383]
MSWILATIRIKPHRARALAWTRRRCCTAFITAEKQAKLGLRDEHLGHCGATLGFFFSDLFDFVLVRYLIFLDRVSDENDVCQRSRMQTPAEICT